MTVKKRNHILLIRLANRFVFRSRYLIVLSALLMHTAVPARAVMQETVTQYGVTFHFDKAYETGLFANGDIWVAGPVTIARITPDYDPANGENGFEANPLVAGGQGLSKHATAGETGGSTTYDPSLIPSLPATFAAGTSIVKAVGNPDYDPAKGFRGLKTAVVLTVVGQVPENGGSGLFRPPFVGNDKPLYRVSDLRTGLLPALAPVGSHVPEMGRPAEAVPCEDIRSIYRVQLDHKTGRIGRCLHPVHNTPDHGADIGRRNAEAILRLFLNDSVSDKTPLLIAVVQYGIDLYHMALEGHTWPAGGGHRPGQKIVIAFAGHLLGHAGMQRVVREASFFHEDEKMYRSRETGAVLYGDVVSGWTFETHELKYWMLVASMGYGAGRSVRDPYQLIDGGPRPGHSYQGCCTSEPWKGSALAMHLCPELKPIWRTTEIFDYADRWTDAGAFTGDDVCAPMYEQENASPDEAWLKGLPGWKTTWGPDPANPGHCIRDTDPADGVGRFPEENNTWPENTAGIGHGGRRSLFVDDLWNAYRHQSGPVNPSGPADVRILKVNSRH